MSAMEQLMNQMMVCWRITEDVKELYYAQDLRQLSEDERQNILLGIFTLGDLKFEKLSNLFDEAYHEFKTQEDLLKAYSEPAAKEEFEIIDVINIDESLSATDR